MMNIVTVSLSNLKAMIANIRNYKVDRFKKRSFRNETYMWKPKGYLY